MVIGGIVGGVVASEIFGGGVSYGGRHHASQGRYAAPTAAIIAGTIAGAAIGGAVGRSMDETDRLKTAATLETVRTGVSSTWRNPDTGSQYAVTPTKTYEASSGPCREYTIDALIGGKKEKVYGTACRQPDGSWKMQS
jgi:surface antigen